MMSADGYDLVIWEEDGTLRDGEAKKQHCYIHGRASSSEMVQEGEGEAQGGPIEGEVTKRRPGDMY